MNSIQIVEINKQPVHNLPEENIKGIFLPKTNFTSSSVGIIEPNETQKKHYHNRPLDGYEIIFIYSGKVVFVSEKEESPVYNVDKNGPIFACVSSQTIAYLKNVGNNEVRFFTVFAPGLNLDELVFFDE